MIEAVKKDEEKPADQRTLDGLLETVVLFIKPNDFERIQEPIKITLKPLINKAPNTLEGILQELEAYGGVKRESFLYRLEDPEKLQKLNFDQISMAITQALQDSNEDSQKVRDKIKKLTTDKQVKELEAF